jgi:hypothetical protein
MTRAADVSTEVEHSDKSFVRMGINGLFDMTARVPTVVNTNEEVAVPVVSRWWKGKEGRAHAPLLQTLAARTLGGVTRVSFALSDSAKTVLVIIVRTDVALISSQFPVPMMLRLLSPSYNNIAPQ